MEFRLSLEHVDECRRMGSRPARRSPVEEPHEWEPTRIFGGFSSSLSERRRPIRAECTRRRLLSGEEGPDEYTGLVLTQCSVVTFVKEKHFNVCPSYCGHFEALCESRDTF